MPLKLLDSQLSFIIDEVREAVDSSSNDKEVGYRQKKEICNGYPLKFLSFAGKLISERLKLLRGMNLHTPQLVRLSVLTGCNGK